MYVIGSNMIRRREFFFGKRGQVTSGGIQIFLVKLLDPWTVVDIAK
jgi:hypothetical protein